jgi:hypothetical protein
MKKEEEKEDKKMKEKGEDRNEKYRQKEGKSNKVDDDDKSFQFLYYSVYQQQRAYDSKH